MKKSPHLFAVLIVGLIGFFSFGTTFAQYDYYDPYSNSNVDYFPSNPVDVSPSPNYSPPPQSTNPSSSGGTSQNSSSGVTTKTTTACANKPEPNPQNTISVEVRAADNKLYELSPPKSELQGWRVSPETSDKIYKGNEEVGRITRDNGCYPKYGYILNPYKLPSTTPKTSTTPNTSSTIPDNATAVTLDPATGKVYRTSTGQLISDARYDPVQRQIYYKNTTSTFGKVFTETTGYVNISYKNEVTTPPPASPLTAQSVDRSYHDEITPKKYDLNNNKDAQSQIDKPGSLETVKPEPEVIESMKPLDIKLSNDRLRKLRYDISTTDQAAEVTVHGWDITHKEAITERPQEVESIEDLEVYVEAVALNDTAIEEIQIKEDILEVNSNEKGRLFGFIPINISSKVAVSFKPQENEDAIELHYPWWHVFVMKSYDSDKLKDELSITLSTQESGNVSDASSALNLKTNSIARLLSVISKAHKTTK
jgi:hypothetical protein